MPNSPEDFKLTVSRIRNFIQSDAKKIMRVEGVKHFKKSFQDEGFTDDVLEPWVDVSEKRKEQKRKKNGNLPPILTDTADLGNSIQGTITGRDITFGSDLPYAQRHNEGLAGMPKRQFMGASRALNRKIEEQLDKGFGRILGRI
jgi:phage gpG-like protein